MTSIWILDNVNQTDLLCANQLPSATPPPVYICPPPGINLFPEAHLAYLHWNNIFLQTDYNFQYPVYPAVDNIKLIVQQIFITFLFQPHLWRGRNYILRCFFCSVNFGRSICSSKRNVIGIIKKTRPA